MKGCPNCRKVYSDDLFFCLDDGSALQKLAGQNDPNAPTEIDYDVASSLRTEVLPRAEQTPKTRVSLSNESPPPRPPSKFLYLVIGTLTLTCVALAAAMIAINRDRIFSAQTSNANVGEISDPKPSPSPTTAAVVASTPPASSPKPINSPAAQPVTNFNPTGKWKGEWSTASGTMLDFDLNLTDTGDGALEGHILWTMRRTVRPDKLDKIGLSATEFVRGTSDPTKRTVNLSGYAKDDPNNVLVMVDVYKLNVSADGRSLTGLARNGGKWNGRIRLSR